MWPLTPTDRPPESGLDVRTVGAPRACRRRPAHGPCGTNRPHVPASHPSQTPPSRASLHVSSTTPELYDPRQGPQPLRNSASSSEKRDGQTSPAACEGRTCVKGFKRRPLPWEHPPGERAPPPHPVLSSPEGAARSCHLPPSAPVHGTRLPPAGLQGPAPEGRARQGAHVAPTLRLSTRRHCSRRRDEPTPIYAISGFDIRVQ